MSLRVRHVFLVLAAAAAIAAAALLLTKPGRKAVRAAAPAPLAETRGLDVSGRTKAERLAVDEALDAFKKEGLLLRVAEDGDAAESDERRDLEEVYGVYHPFFVRGDLDGDGKLDFAQAFVEKGNGGPWFHVAVFFGTGDGTFRKPLWVERAISLAAGDITIERSLLIVTPDLELDPSRRWRWEAGEKRFVDADAASRRRNPADEDGPDETPDQKPRARV
ncbi:MAG TPA: hypothetical protein VFZ57_10380 [Thermoanaerobaculia bacterium]|nr:hypothetical protein [Thermoanaerobaculia bacterium]